MKGIGDLMKQAQNMQKQMQEMQKKIELKEFEGQSAGGMVKVVMNGKFETKSIKLDKNVVSPDDVEVLEDVITAAVNDAKAKVDIGMKKEMESITGGLNLPEGMNLPF